MHLTVETLSQSSLRQRSARRQAVKLRQAPAVLPRNASARSNLREGGPTKIDLSIPRRPHLRRP